jgi:hypothetical protein
VEGFGLDPLIDALCELAAKDERGLFDEVTQILSQRLGVPVLRQVG